MDLSDTLSIMKLSDTVTGMISTDYKERFKTEYQQLAIRYFSLKNMVEAWDNGELKFIPTCERGVYNWQLSAMWEYLEVLKVRADIEGIILK